MNPNWKLVNMEVTMSQTVYFYEDEATGNTRTVWNHFEYTDTQCTIVRTVTIIKDSDGNILEHIE